MAREEAGEARDRDQQSQIAREGARDVFRHCSTSAVIGWFVLQYRIRRVSRTESGRTGVWLSEGDHRLYYETVVELN